MEIGYGSQPPLRTISVCSAERGDLMHQPNKTEEQVIIWALFLFHSAVNC